MHEWSTENTLKTYKNLVARLMRVCERESREQRVFAWCFVGVEWMQAMLWMFCGLFQNLKGDSILFRFQVVSQLCLRDIWYDQKPIKSRLNYENSKLQIIYSVFYKSSIKVSSLKIISHEKPHQQRYYFNRDSPSTCTAHVSTNEKKNERKRERKVSLRFHELTFWTLSQTSFGVHSRRFPFHFIFCSAVECWKLFWKLPFTSSKCCVAKLYDVLPPKSVASGWNEFVWSRNFSFKVWTKQLYLCSPVTYINSTLRLCKSYPQKIVNFCQKISAQVLKLVT